MNTKTNERKKNVSAVKRDLIEKSIKAKAKIKLLLETAKTDQEILAAASLKVNDILMDDHKAKSGANTFKTFKQWKEDGYKVNKGETSYKIWSSPIKGKREIEVTEVNTGENKTIEENYSMFGICHLFNEKQVTKEDEKSFEPKEEKTYQEEHTKTKNLSTNKKETMNLLDVIEALDLSENKSLGIVSRMSEETISDINKLNAKRKLEVYTNSNKNISPCGNSKVSLIKSDFITISPSTEYDVMLCATILETTNQNNANIKHALNFVKEGGQLIALIELKSLLNNTIENKNIRTFFAENKTLIQDRAIRCKFDDKTIKTVSIIRISKQRKEIDGSAINPYTCENYIQKQEGRTERLAQRAKKAQSASNALYENGHKLAEAIPFGQPILVGHNSENKDRRYRAKFCNMFDKSMSLDKKAKELNRRANKVGNGGIASDDPKAKVKLTEKLIQLTATQEFRKLTNTAIKNNNTTRLIEIGFKEETANKMVTEKFKFERYELTNNSAEIRRIKKRLETLTELENTPIINFSNDEFNATIEDGRIQITFNMGKPCEETRNTLKNNAYKWSRYSESWVRKATINATRQAPELINRLVLINSKVTANI